MAKTKTAKTDTTTEDVARALYDELLAYLLESENLFGAVRGELDCVGNPVVVMKVYGGAFQRRVVQARQVVEEHADRFGVSRSALPWCG